jgi:hypothetical protein
VFWRWKTFGPPLRHSIFRPTSYTAPMPGRDRIFR